MIAVDANDTQQLIFVCRGESKFKMEMCYKSENTQLIMKLTDISKWIQESDYTIDDNMAPKLNNSVLRKYYNTYRNITNRYDIFFNTELYTMRFHLMHSIEWSLSCMKHRSNWRWHRVSGFNGFNLLCNNAELEMIQIEPMPYVKWSHYAKITQIMSRFDLSCARQFTNVLRNYCVIGVIYASFWTCSDIIYFFRMNSIKFTNHHHHHNRCIDDKSQRRKRMMTSRRHTGAFTRSILSSILKRKNRLNGKVKI